MERNTQGVSYEMGMEETHVIDEKDDVNLHFTRKIFAD